MTENETIATDSEILELVPQKKTPFWQKKYVLAIAAATAAVLVGGYFLSKSESSEEDESTDESTVTEEVMSETPEL